MRLAGLHHVTMITGNVQRTVDFYADLLGLRLVKKTINFDDPYALKGSKSTGIASIAVAVGCWWSAF